LYQLDIRKLDAFNEICTAILVEKKRVPRKIPDKLLI
jgi:hypothetical protein